ncbi:MAG: sel1 repeat family protein, partial [Sphingobacteriales bacterium]
MKKQYFITLLFLFTSYTVFSQTTSPKTLYDEFVVLHKAKKYEAAILPLSKAAEQGYARAQYNLGLMYEEGIGVLQDKKEAISWYFKAAEQGVADAQYNLGIMYTKGEGVLQDKKEAVNWYRKAAEQGNAKAQYKLGF